MKQCTCRVVFPDTRLLQAEEHWHCLECGWPVPANHWRIKQEISDRKLRAVAHAGGMPLHELLDAAAVADLELDRMLRDLRRSRRIIMTGLVGSLIIFALSLAQLFGMLNDSSVTYIVAFGASFAITLGYLNIAIWWRQRNG